MRIAIIGAGALGLYYGALLQRAGNDVRFLLRRDYDAIVRQGLHITSPNGDFHLSHLDAFVNSAEMGEVDLVLVGLKTFANEQLIPLTAPLMNDGTAIVLTLQNGLGNEELLSAAYGEERVLGGVAFLCANRGEPGTVHHLSQGAIRLGACSATLFLKAQEVATVFAAAGIPCEAVADLVKARWEKLVWNIPFNGLSTLTGQTTDRLLAHPPTRKEIVGLMEEVIVAANLCHRSPPINAERFIARMLELTLGMGPYRPSMMIDRAEGRPLEIEAIYNLPLARAEDRGLAMTRVRMLAALLALGEFDQPAAQINCR